LSKILEVEQKNTVLLREIARKQLRLEETIENRFSTVINTITSLKEQQSALSEINYEGQKDKKIEPFFKVYFIYCYHLFFHLNIE
jgi:hypothetical protein